MKSFSILVATVCFLIASAVSLRAQYVWNTVHTDFDGRYYYCFDAISAEELNITVAGEVIDTTEHQLYSAIFQSFDGGVTFRQTRLDLPFDTSLVSGTRGSFTSADQITSFDVVVAGSDMQDTTLVERTFDGGVTWVRQGPRIAGTVKDINFFDSLQGILIIEPDTILGTVLCHKCGTPKVFTTTDGGRNWSYVASFDNIMQSHSFGNGSSKVFAPAGGGFFASTSDNWKTDTIIGPFLDSSSNPTGLMGIIGCRFLSLDTIIAYGGVTSQNYDTSQGVIIRSTDGGKSWKKPQIFPAINFISQASKLNGDTLIAGGASYGHILRSTDKGVSWVVDSLRLDTDFNAYYLEGLAAEPTGNFLAIFCTDYTAGGIPSIIARGSSSADKVDLSGYLEYHARIFPNPATTILNIASVEESTPFRIYDLLGRIVQSGKVGDHSTITVDVSSLGRGAYVVIVDNPSGVPVIVGKLMLISN